MIKFTCQPPHIRSNKISAGITILQNRDNDYLKEFNVKIGHEMTIVDARVLPAPSISYHPASKEPVITPREGYILYFVLSLLMTFILGHGI